MDGGEQRKKYRSTCALFAEVSRRATFCTATTSLSLQHAHDNSGRVPLMARDVEALRIKTTR